MNVIALRALPGLPATVADVGPWLKTTEALRQRAQLKALLVHQVQERESWQTERQAAKLLVNALLRGTAPTLLQDAAAQLARNDKAVSLGNFQKWLRAYRERGMDGLLDDYKGKQRKLRGCEHLILGYYQRPTRINPGAISFLLKQDHGLDVPGWWIRKYLQSLPASITTHSPKRNGANYTAQNIRPHVRRDPDSIEVGEMWVSDGHCLKVMGWHPFGADLIRPEVTPILDKRSNYCYGFWVSRAENAMDTVYALCSVMRRHNHVPVFFQTDPGPGFKNARVRTLLREMGCLHTPTRAANARGKDFGEGFFHILTDRFSRTFDTCTANDRTDDALARMRTKIKRGELRVPYFDEIVAGLEKFRVAYNAWPQPKSVRLQGLSPDEMHAQLKRRPLGIPVEMLIRPYVDPNPTVRKSEVQFKNRYYGARELAAYNGRKVRVQYDENDESVVWLEDDKGRYIGTANLARKAPTVRESVRADAHEASRKAAKKRVDIRGERVDEKYNAPLDAGTTLQQLEQGHGFAVPAAVPAPSRRVTTADETLKGIEYFDPLNWEAPESRPEPLDLEDTSYGGPS